MEIHEIKSQLSILNLVAHYNHQPNKNNLIQCPFHDDKTPSLQLYPKTNTWHCFGCGKGSDTIDFIQFKENCNIHEALKKATSCCNPERGEGSKHLPTTNTKLMNNPPTKELTPLQRIETLTQAFTYFARSTHTAAKKYLEKRNLQPEKLIYGYDAHNFHKGISEELKTMYLAIGLLYPDKLGRENNYHSFFDNCIVFPTFNENNEIVNLYGRCIDDSKASKHRYLPGKHQGIYPQYPTPETEILIISECIIDCATLLQDRSSLNFGPSHLPTLDFLSCYGVNNFTIEHQNAIKNLHQLKEVIFFYDGDAAGRSAITAHSEIIKKINQKIKISYVATPDNEDINSLLQGHESSIFANLLSNRVMLNGSEASIKTNNDPAETTTNISLSTNQHISNLNTDNAEQLMFENEYLTITVWGGIEINNIKRLRATLHLQSKSNKYLEYRDTIDLYSHAQTQKLIREASERLETGTNTMTITITDLTKALETYRQQAIEEERKKEKNEEQQQIPLTATEKNEALQLAKDKNLINRFGELLTQVGIVGEEENKIFAMTVAISSQFNNPLNCLIQGSSGSGKTNLMTSVCSCMPANTVKMYTRVSDKMLYHVGKDYFVKKVVCFHDVDSLSEEVELIIRELISNGNINTGISYKDDKGNIATKELIVNGPLTTFACTTKGAMYLDNMTRVLIIVMDESEEQTERIIEKYLQKSNDKLSNTEEEIARKQLQNFVQILAPYAVYNPYASSLKLPKKLRDRRRLQMLYIQYVDTITNLFQHQRKQTKEGKLIATKEDCLLAFKLMFDCILIKLDELDGSLRQFYEKLKEWVQLKCNGQLKGFVFTQREIRQALNMNNQSLKRYMTDLLELEYVEMKSGNKNGSTNKYEIQYWDDYGKMKESLKEEMRKQIEDLPE